VSFLKKLAKNESWSLKTPTIENSKFNNIKRGLPKHRKLNNFDSDESTFAA
jgi:hypothetical protein